MLVTANQRLMYRGQWIGAGNEFDGDENDKTIIGYLAKGVVSPKKTSAATEVVEAPKPKVASVKKPAVLVRPHLQKRDLQATEDADDKATSRRRYNRRDLAAKE